MCSKAPKAPAVVVRDPVADQAAADNAAQARANSETAMRRKKMRANSLFTTGPRGLPSGAPISSAWARAQGESKVTTLGGTP